MTRKLGLKISLFANAGLIVLIALLAARPGFRAYANAMDASSLSALKHGERMSFRRDGFRHFCAEQDGERLDTLAAFVEAKLDLSTRQVESMDQLMDTVKTSATDSFATVCADLSADTSSATAPERLSRLQTVLEAGSTAIAQVRPSLDSFYASLTDAQQQELNGLLSHGRQHHHGEQAD